MNAAHGHGENSVPNASYTASERISPMYFGSGGEQLYACHHLPASAVTPTRALLLCSSVLHEYELVHRALLQLAVLAARRGFHAMRFDYFGSGDSAGDCSEISLARCRRDELVQRGPGRNRHVHDA